MLADVAKPYTVEDFEAFVDLPENDDKIFEFIAGELFETSSSPCMSRIAARISRYLDVYVDENELGHITGADGGYKIGNDRYAPDVAFVSKKRQEHLAESGYNPLAPDLAVEVVSPTDRDKRISIKIANYLRLGTTVWMVYPETKEVVIYVPGQPVEIVGVEDTLAGGSALPGFSLEVKKMFPDC